MNNPYTILGVSPNSTDDEIKEAYRKLAKKYHPDINPDKELAETKMKEINYAYDTIKKMRESGSTYSSDTTNSYSYDNTNSSSYDFVNVEHYIRIKEYMLARMALFQIPRSSSLWYYYSAIISFNLRDFITAENHIDIACNLEPNNQTYKHLKQEMEKLYYQRKQTRTYKFSFGRLLFSLLKFYIIINVISFIIRLFVSFLNGMTPAP